MLNIRNFFIILTLTFLITVYLKQIPTNINKSENYNNNLIKHIVAYSLKKKIEIESEPIACEENKERLIFSDADLFVNGKWNRLEDSEFYVYSVYEDARLAPYNYVRVLGMAKGNWNETLFCNLISQNLSKNISVQVTRAIRTDIWSENWIDENAYKNFNPILFSCQIPNLNEEAQLYLNKNPCETSNKTLIYSTVHKNYHKFTYKRRNSKVALCVKPLDFKKDISRKLIEWIEINKILGGSYFNIFVKNVHPNVMKVLKWYGSHEKRFRVVKFVSPSTNGWDIWQKRKTEILTYNDCFYYNLDLVDYVLPIDIDEIIIPKAHYSWQEFFSNFPKNYASYSARNAYFLIGPNRTNETFFYKTFQRTRFSDIGESGKSFVSTNNALTVFNHYALHNLKPGISRCYFIPEDLAQMNHYKENCPVDLLPECIKYVSSPRVFDDVMLKYKTIFEFNLSNVLRYFL